MNTMKKMRKVKIYVQTMYHKQHEVDGSNFTKNVLKAFSGQWSSYCQNNIDPQIGPLQALENRYARYGSFPARSADRSRLTYIAHLYRYIIDNNEIKPQFILECGGYKSSGVHHGVENSLVKFYLIMIIPESYFIQYRIATGYDVAWLL